jgi:hypothetical protein
MIGHRSSTRPARRTVHSGRQQGHRGPARLGGGHGRIGGPPPVGRPGPDRPGRPGRQVRGGRSLVFGTASDKALEKFKDELWALDEYAGIRRLDPGDADGTLLDIRVQPNLAPLRRAPTARLSAAGPATLAELRVWTVHETIFRQADATKAVQAMVAAGGVARTPPGGRISVDTVLALSDR